jgi:hypothetical protein
MRDFKRDNSNLKILLYTDLQKPYIDDLRDILLQEQGYLCAYCLQRIEKDTMKIEHWYPRCLCKNAKNDIDENLKCNCKKQTSKDCSQIDYKNLIAVCKGITSVEDLYRHCDTLRGDVNCVKQELSINPCKQNDIAKISFSNTGKLAVNPNFPISETDAKKLKDDIENKLGLNQKHIVENRKSALLSVKDFLDERGWSVANYRKKLDEYKTRRNGKFKPYNEYIIWYLEKKIRKTF